MLGELHERVSELRGFMCLPGEQLALTVHPPAHIPLLYLSQCPASQKPYGLGEASAQVLLSPLGGGKPSPLTVRHHSLVPPTAP